MLYTLNIKEVTYSLSKALDLVGVDDILHGKRVAYMAAQVAKDLGWDEKSIDEIIYTGMLHDCGVSSTDVHSHLVNELDWDNAQVHCRQGANLLEKTSIYKQYSPYILYHHTHWSDLPKELDEAIKIKSNLIYMVDRVDALRAQMKDLGVRSTNSIQETIKKYKKEMFAPELVDSFLKISQQGSFWFFLEPDALEEYYMEWIQTGVNEQVSFEHLKEIALMFAAIVDAKSTFTSEHSLGVASLSRYLAQQFKLEKRKIEQVELAGLLHDLGKLKVDDFILNKPSALNADERLKMNRHGFDSDIILKRIKGFKEIAHLASLHHETLDAKGYPYGLNESEIPFEARIIAVADIFQALIQERPYRGGLSKEEALEIILEMTQENKLDVTIVNMLKEHLDDAYKIALHRELI